MIYLYGIAERACEPPAAAGIAGVPVRCLPAGPVAAVYSAHGQLEVRLDGTSAWTHERVVEAVMQTSAILPARFGTTFAGEKALQRTLASQADGLQRRLAQVRGCVELAVRVTVEPDVAAPVGGEGRNYLEAKLQAQRQTEDIVNRRLAPLSALAADLRLPTRSRSGATVSISYLVRSPDVERFCTEATRIQSQTPGLSLSCTGPWALYSFSQEPAA